MKSSLASLLAVAGVQDEVELTPDGEHRLPLERKSASFKVGSSLVSVAASPASPLTILGSVGEGEDLVYKTSGPISPVDSLVASCYVSAGLKRIARGLRLVAYNADFDLYVKDIIREHGLPVDESINWASWLDSVYYRVAPGNPEVKDEAIHNVIITNLLVRDALGNNFADGKAIPGRLSEAIISKMPVEEQVTWYLKQMFKFRVSEAIDWVVKDINSRNQTTPMERENEEGETYNLIDLQDDNRAPKDEVIDNLEYQSELKEFTDKFFPWLKEELGENRGGRFIKLFTLLESTTDDEWGDVVKKFEDEMDRSVNWLDNNILTLSRYIRQFLDETGFNPSSLLVRLLNDYDARRLKKNLSSNSGKRTKEVASPKTSSLRKEQMMDNGKRETLRTRLAKKAEENKKAGKQVGTKQARTVREILESRKPATKQAAVKPVKFAALRRLAEENPEQMAEALNELKEFYVEQAEAVDTLMENAGLTPLEELPKEASLKQRIASRKAQKVRFAAFRQIAEEAPEEFQEAVQELYDNLDEGAEAIENLAENTGVELEEPKKDEE